MGRLTLLPETARAFDSARRYLGQTGEAVPGGRERACRLLRREPHPFYLENSADRADPITFLKGLGGPGANPGDACDAPA